jgi:hypothetical protein
MKKQVSRVLIFCCLKKKIKDELIKSEQKVSELPIVIWDHLIGDRFKTSHKVITGIIYYNLLG